MSSVFGHSCAERFGATCLGLGVRGSQLSAIWDELTTRYAEPHRHYHTPEHVGRMLHWFDRSPGGGDAIELAIWFHDSVYEPLESDNEVRSADFFSRSMAAAIKRSIAEDVRRLILATCPARPRSGQPDEDLLIDIDLSILGACPSEYEAYRLAVRKEYSAVPEAEFAAGRKALLESLLARRIYVTDFFGDLEQQARTNIETELNMI